MLQHTIATPQNTTIMQHHGFTVLMDTRLQLSHSTMSLFQNVLLYVTSLHHNLTPLCKYHLVVIDHHLTVMMLSAQEILWDICMSNKLGLCDMG